MSFDDNNQTTSVSSSAKPRFFGSYDHTIDAKGRIIIPNPYRKALGNSFTLTVDLDDVGIAIYPDEVFDEFIQELYRLNRRKPEVQLQQDHIAKYSYPGMQADSQGRILLPIKLRQYALGEAKDVEISGAIDHIRVIDSRTGTEADSFYKEHNRSIREKLANDEN